MNAHRRTARRRLAIETAGTAGWIAAMVFIVAIAALTL